MRKRPAKKGGFWVDLTSRDGFITAPDGWGIAAVKGPWRITGATGRPGVEFTARVRIIRTSE